MVANPTLPPELTERVLARIGFDRAPEPTLAGLSALYARWCANVPFDNLRKLIHVRAGNAGPLPGTTAEDYFNAWLQHGTGGTCWSGAGALQSLLTALGFDAVRAIGTMLVAPDLPPNHGSVRVTFDQAQYLVDTSILHGEPLRLEADAETRVAHPAWGVQCSRKEDRWHVQWRPLHKPDGFECRFERFDSHPAEYAEFYERTRGWGPFNYEVTARKNRNDSVIGLAFGHAVELRADGSVAREPVTHAERQRRLIEVMGYGEEIVRQLPEDVPTPPPPGSRTAGS